MKNKVFQLIFIIIFSLLVTSCSNKNNYTLNIGEQKILSKLVYNKVVASEEEIDMIELKRQERFSNNIFFSKIIIHDSFYITTRFDFEMAPFFDETSIRKNIDTVVAVLGFYDLDGKEMNIITSIVIFKYEDNIQGFVSASGSNLNKKIQENDSLTFASYIFLTKNIIVKQYEEGDNLYNFTLNIHEDDFDFKVDKSIGFVSKDIANYEIEVMEDSYRELDSSITEDIINLAYVEQKAATATVLSLDTNKGVIIVTSEDIPTLTSISFKIAILDSKNNPSTIDKLSIGRDITFYYYQRYIGYSPTHLSVENIYI